MPLRDGDDYSFSSARRREGKGESIYRKCRGVHLKGAQVHNSMYNVGYRGIFTLRSSKLELRL